MSKIQKTFYEDTELGIILNWIDEVIWNHAYTTQPRDPADMQSMLSNKIKITVEIYGEDKSISIDQYMALNPEIDPHEQYEVDDTLLGLDGEETWLP